VAARLRSVGSSQEMLCADAFGLGRGRRGEQVARALGTHAVVAVAEQRAVPGLVGKVRQLVKDNVGTEPGHRPREGAGVEDIAHNGLRAKLVQQAGVAG
jgi:hypothetical protein